MSQRLYRSRADRVLGGVCGGLGAQFDVDPIIFRLVFILMTVMGGSGLLIYVIMWIVIPREQAGPAPVQAAPGVPVDTIPALVDPSAPAAPARGGRGGAAVGVILVAVGLLFLATNLGLFWWWKWKVLWPLVLVAMGLWMLFGRNGKE